MQEALKKSPEDAATHWQLGQVWINGRWMTPEQAQKAAGRRQAAGRISQTAGPKPPDRRQPGGLGPLVPQKQAADEERAHWQTVLQLQPDNAEAIKALGLRPFAGTLLTPGQIQQVKSQLQTWAKAVDRWRPLVASGATP